MPYIAIVALSLAFNSPWSKLVSPFLARVSTWDGPMWSSYSIPKITNLDTDANMWVICFLIRTPGYWHLRMRWCVCVHPSALNSLTSRCCCFRFCRFFLYYYHYYYLLVTKWLKPGLITVLCELLFPNLFFWENVLFYTKTPQLLVDRFYYTGTHSRSRVSHCKLTMWLRSVIILLESTNGFLLVLVCVDWFGRCGY